VRIVTVLAALSGGLAVAAGAFAAHGVSGQAADWLKTGGHYQLIHAVAALVAVRMGERISPWLFLAGGAVFAGTLYLMAFGAPHWLGAITPIGGAALIAGWICLAIGAWRVR
jgi:uncharacterized membrane protein YgdD (TMEM256/DUF423 family)